MKREKGITIIALVITIIVLLILAGVSILLVLGNNGVLTQATNAVQKNRAATAEEEVEMAWASVTSEYWAEWANNSSVNKSEYLADNFSKYLTGTGTATITNKGDGTYSIKYNKTDRTDPYEFEANEDGSIDMLGKGNASEIAASSDNIGKAVNYDVSYSSIGTGSGWQILYADNSNVYIITTGYLTASTLTAPATGSTYGGTGDFTTLDTSKYPAVVDGWLNKIYDNGELKYTSEKPNMKATEYILDSTNEKWSGLANNYAKWVIGSPTLEMMVSSYNAVNTSSTKTINALVEDGNGYKQTLVGGTLPNDASRPWNHGTHYWLACPSGNDENNVRGVSAGIDGVFGLACSNSFAFRPVVCLNSNVKLTWNSETNQFDLSNS